MAFLDLDPMTLAALGVAFLLGGVLKGVAGAGLPMVLVSAAASVMSPAVAVALATVPLFSSNVVQTWQGRRYWPQILGFWPLMVPLFALTVVGARILVTVDPKIIALILGSVVILFSLTRSGNPRVAPASMTWLGPLVGSLSGLLGGVSSFHGPPLLMYFSALRLPKDLFVPLLGACFVVGGLPLYASLAYHHVLTPEVFLASVVAAVPVQLGMELGRRLRGRVSEQAFRKLVTVILVVIGLNLVRRGLG